MGVEAAMSSRDGPMYKEPSYVVHRACHQRYYVPNGFLLLAWTTWS